MGRSNKGSPYERELCKLLSMWWTSDERDDVFWRTSGSGGRATNRRMQGKTTYGGGGDIQAVDPIGQPLIDLMALEAKRGHPDAHLGDILDRRPGKPRPWEKLIHQAQGQQTEESFYWAMISRRDYRLSMIYIPWDLYKELGDVGCQLNRAKPWIKVKPTPNSDPDVPVIRFLFATRLSEFLHYVKRKDVERLVKILKET